MNQLCPKISSQEKSKYENVLGIPLMAFYNNVTWNSCATSNGLYRLKCTSIDESCSHVNKIINYFSKISQKFKREILCIIVCPIVIYLQHYFMWRKRNTILGIQYPLLSYRYHFKPVPANIRYTLFISATPVYVFHSFQSIFITLFISKYVIRFTFLNTQFHQNDFNSFFYL